jgi:hypothetical protein
MLASLTSPPRQIAEALRLRALYIAAELHAPSRLMCRALK